MVSFMEYHSVILFARRGVFVIFVNRVYGCLGTHFFFVTLQGLGDFQGLGEVFGMMGVCGSALFTCFISLR